MKMIFVLLVTLTLVLMPSTQSAADTNGTIAYYGLAADSDVTYLASDLVLVDPITRNERTISLEGRFTGPTTIAWAPSGDRVAITHATGEDAYYDVVHLDMDGTFDTVAEPEQPEQHVFVQGYFPDGSGLLYAQEIIGGDASRYTLYAHNFANAQNARVNNDFVGSYGPGGLSWHPENAQQFLFAGVNNLTDTMDLYHANLETGELLRLTDHPLHDYSPQWTSDGTQIIYTSEHADGPSTSIHIMDANGENQRQLIDLPYSSLNPLRVDDNTIVYVAHDWRPEDEADFRAELRWYDLDTEEDTVLVEKSVIDAYDVSPDGTQIAYLSRETWRGTPTLLCVLDITQQEEEWCADFPPFNATDVAWGPD